MSWRSRLSPAKLCVAVALTALFTGIGLLNHRETFEKVLPLHYLFSQSDYEREAGIAPADLMRLGIYKNEDFVNEDGVIPAYWNCANNLCNISSVWGPCYAPRGRINWELEIEQSKDDSPRFHKMPVLSRMADDLSDFCRPGFVIIGAGKCGTSSLYHYLTDHPRVLPAKKKQIHYFKYYANNPLKWYYNHFPTATNFLASGALMTGEASPGYMPYPDVAHLIRRRMPGSRFIAVARDPLERAYSSYRYNYVTPTIEELTKGKFGNRILPNQPREYYEKFLFSFEDMIRAELQTLRNCLAPGGIAEFGAQEAYGSYVWAREEMTRRNVSALPPLLDLDGFCYGDEVNSSLLRYQWTEMVARHPEKVISSRNVHLKQSLLGRGLYVLPLEWWYALFPRQDIYFMCTEELRDLSGDSMNGVARFLGLPRYNFSSTVQGGSYNVGDHRGYDAEVSWEDLQNSSRTITLPDDLRREVLAFIKPFNERLFALTGRRCDWA